MTADEQIEVNSILEDYRTGEITEAQRDEAINAIANRGNARRRMRERIDENNV